MSITPEVIESIRTWAAQGIDLNGIQKNLTEAGVSIRFMDLRFLLLDHAIEIAEIAASTPAPAEEQVPVSQEATPVPATPTATPPASTTAAMVKVSLDELQIPGTMLSGKALFTSGIRGAWSFDATGAFSWNDLSGRPTETELQAFQHELNIILSQGMS